VSEYNEQAVHGQQSRYETIPFADELFPIRILWDLRTKQTDVRTQDPLWHEQLEILYITQGSMICECNFQHYLCHEGDIVIINPYEAHAVAFHEEEARYHCLMVDPRLYSGQEDISGVKYMKPMSERRVRFRHVIRENEHALQVLMALLEEYRAASPAFEIAVKGHLLCLLAELFRNEVASDDSQRSRVGASSIAPALHHIAERYFEDITLDDLANCCCMNRSYFCRRFRTVTGTTAITYLNQYRLAKARAMLITTDYTVSQIALLTGFPDSNYFTRLFTKHYGTAPREMRRLQQED